MAQSTSVGGHQTGFGENRRTDKWWLEPVITVAVFTSFIIYATWAAFQGNHYFTEAYLSPFYSPILFQPGSESMAWAAGGSTLASIQHHTWLGAWPTWWPQFLPQSPAFLILAFPGAFRFTCYYYRKAYYRAFTGSPPACAVGGIKQKNYKGETRLLLFQNLHRYAMYFAVIFVFILSYDAFCAFFKGGIPFKGDFGVGVGSLVLVINAILLGSYTFGCHSFRHLIGGRKDCFSCDFKPTTSHKAWSLSSLLNRKHMAFAWLSLFWVAFSDIYVRLVSMGVWTDLNTWN